MTYVMLLNMQVILLFIYFIVKNFKKVFIYYFIVDYIIIYRTIIISNILDQIASCMELKIAKS